MLPVLLPADAFSRAFVDDRLSLFPPSKDPAAERELCRLDGSAAPSLLFRCAEAGRSWPAMDFELTTLSDGLTRPVLAARPGYALPLVLSLIPALLCWATAFVEVAVNGCLRILLFTLDFDEVWLRFELAAEDVDVEDVGSDMLVSRITCNAPSVLVLVGAKQTIQCQ